MQKETPINETVWHRGHVFFPVRTVDRQWTVGDVWQRICEGKWQYKPIPLTDDEMSDLTTY